MLDTQIPIQNSDFKLEQFDDEILLYSITDTRAIYLNNTAFLVYGMCGSGQSIGEIISLLEEAYPEQRDTIRGDVIAALEQLRQIGALTLND